MQLRQHLGEVFCRLAEQRESRIDEGHLTADLVHMVIAIPPKSTAFLICPGNQGKTRISK